MRAASPWLYLAVVLCLLLGGLGGWLLAATGLAEEIEGPFVKEEGAGAAFFNALLFASLLLAGALLLLALTRIRFALVKALGYFAFFMAAFLVGETFTVACGVEPAPATFASLAFALSATLSLALRPLSPLVVLTQVAVGSLTGSIIAAMVPPASLVAMLAAAAAYDLYAVYKGPLKRLLDGLPKGPPSRGESDRRPSPLTPFTVNVGGVALGMGDVVLYGATSSLALLTPSPDVLRMLLVIPAAIVGLALTLKLAEKRGYAPALPLPVALALAAYLAYNAIKRV
ncbi:MAG: hypothetical protein LM580_01090 [Thermofilum sp.]|nr:hypothetical protein [Thermofilum sp.]